MDIRRVQITGGSSYIITLPKSWINSQKIKSKQKVGIVTKPDGNLLIIPDMSKESSHKIKKIFISIDLDDELVFRMLLGAYIMGFEEIHVESKVEIPPKVRNTVSKFINAVDKFEISEESDTIIKIKDMLDDKVSFEKKIIGINTLVQSMFTEALKALNQNNIPLCEQVIKTDTFLNTKAWLIVRQMNQLFENSSLEVTIPPKILHHYGIISQYLGRIGNYSAEIAENIIKLINLESAPISQPIINEISKISEEILVDLNNSLDILFLTFAQESNPMVAVKTSNDCIKAGFQVREECADLYSYAYQNVAYIPLVLILESLVKIGDLITNIGEITIDTLMLLHDLSFT